MTFVKKKRARVKSGGTFVGTRVKVHAEMEKLFIEDQTQDCQNK